MEIYQIAQRAIELTEAPEYSLPEAIQAAEELRVVYDELKRSRFAILASREDMFDGIDTEESDDGVFEPVEEPPSVEEIQDACQVWSRAVAQQEAVRSRELADTEEVTEEIQKEVRVASARAIAYMEAGVPAGSASALAWRAVFNREMEE